MPAVQSSYTGTLPIGVLGQNANMESWNGLSRLAEGSIGFAAPVARGARYDSCKPYAAVTDDFLGVTFRDPTLLNVGADLDHYVDGDTVAIAETGVVIGRAGGTVTVGAAARWDTAALDWVATGGIAVPGVEFDTAGDDGDLVRLRVKRLAGAGEGATNPTIVDIEIIPNTRTIDLSNAETYTLQVEERYSDGSSDTANNTTEITFSGNNVAVATVSAAGLVTPVGVGSTTVTATHTASGKTDTATITVVA